MFVSSEDERGSPAAVWLESDALDMELSTSKLEVMMLLSECLHLFDDASLLC